MRSRTRVVTASLLVGVALMGWTTPAAAAPAYPKPGRCVDRTDVLGGALCAKVTTILKRDEKATSDEIAVAVVPTTGDESIEAWTTGLFNSWGVGKKDKNNGVLLVVAVDDHRVRLETGRGVTKRLTDREAKAIVDGVVTPRFAAGDYQLGILAGLDEVRRELGHSLPANARLESLAEPAGDEPDSDFVSGGGTGSGYVADGDFAFPDDSGDDEGSGSAWAILIVALAGIGLIFAVVSRAAGAVSGAPRGSSPSWVRPAGGLRSPHHHHHHTAWVAGSTDTSAPTFSSSPDTGSSFGGGSSDGSGASGSW
ncbi:TPM domain-containing protein [Couchioplanes caeruleus]|uniref:TPM domain-containing protein n=1 Tax=Couchioplanes caeruleus TaxID=56438 RepID=UPI0020BEDA4D|nr:TPM domain-containing protein [Couchioplanes caeruleus]UQU65733.1 TPM domain-containing protein [Couchioplanes caeruleus]